MAEDTPRQPHSQHTRTLNLQGSLPNVPPRPHTADFEKLTIMLYQYNNPIYKFDRGVDVRIGRHQSGDVIRWNNLDFGIYDAGKRSVSRRHCQLLALSSGHYLMDMHSRNGTWLNGVRLQPEKQAQLRSRDYVQVGSIGFWVFLPHHKSH